METDAEMLANDFLKQNIKPGLGNHPIHAIQTAIKIALEKQKEGYEAIYHELYNTYFINGGKESWKQKRKRKKLMKEMQQNTTIYSNQPKQQFQQPLEVPQPPPQYREPEPQYQQPVPVQQPIQQQPQYQEPTPEPEPPQQQFQQPIQSPHVKQPIPQTAAVHPGLGLPPVAEETAEVEETDNIIEDDIPTIQRGMINDRRY